MVRSCLVVVKGGFINRMALNIIMKKLMKPPEVLPNRRMRAGLVVGALALATCAAFVFRGKEPIVETTQASQTHSQSIDSSGSTSMPKKHRKVRKMGFLDRLKAANEKRKEEELVRRASEALGRYENGLHRQIETFDDYFKWYDEKQQDIRIIEIALRITHGSSNSDLIKSNSDSIYFRIGEAHRVYECVPDHLRSARGELFRTAEEVRGLITELNPQNPALADVRLRASELLQEVEGYMHDFEGLMDSIEEQATDFRRLELITRKMKDGRDFSDGVINPLYVDALAGIEERARGLGIN